MRSKVLLCSSLVLILAACTDDQTPRPAAASTQIEPPITEPAQNSKTSPDLTAAAGVGADGNEAQAAAAVARLSAAQAYLNSASDRARARFDKAMRTCATLLASDRADCENSATSSEEAELRAGRVEFDRRMSEEQ